LKNLLKYNEFVREYLVESNLPYSIEKDLQSLKLKWSDRKDLIEKIIEEKGKDSTHVHALSAKNENRELTYIFKSWFSEGSYWIELFEDDYPIFVQDYNSEEKRYFDRDCESILGRKL
jgi:hypothetical protein